MCISCPCPPTRLSCSQRSGCGPSPTPHWSTDVQRISTSWTPSSWTAVWRCRPIRLSSPPSSPRRTITGGPLTILQGREPSWYNCTANFIDWQFASESAEELLDPIRSQYHEFLLLVRAELEGGPVM